MRENRVKRALREGTVTVGSWVTMEGTLGAELMANAGFDWLLIDMEHGPLSMTAAQSSSNGDDRWSGTRVDAASGYIERHPTGY